MPPATTGFPVAQIEWLAANRDRVARYLCIPQLLVALLFLGFAYYTGHTRVRLLSHGVAAQGRILSFRAERMSHQTRSSPRLSDTDYAYFPTVEFAASGGVVRFEEWMGMRSDSGVGSLVPILYDSTNPAVAMIDRGLLNWLPWGVCLLIGLPLLLAGLSGLLRLALAARARMPVGGNCAS